jgi:hypothetical protein
MLPLMVMAGRVTPVKLTGAFRTYKSYSTVLANDGENWAIRQQHRNGKKWEATLNMNRRKVLPEKTCSFHLRFKMKRM